MKTVGIVVEYNPFHNGHLYHIQKSKLITGADIVVAVMSGHFLQRGEPAIFDKWTRAKMALLNDVDVVIELPVTYATQNAETFAYGAISILEQLNCIDYLCFGSESGEISILNNISDLMHNETSLFKNILQTYLNIGFNYPTAYFKTINEIQQNLTNKINNISNVTDNTNLLNAPNNMLGLMYLTALKKLKSNIKPYTIKRIAADYNQQSITDNSIASATAIRKLYLENGVDDIDDINDIDNIDDIKDYIPKNCYDLIINNYKSGVSFNDFRDILFAIINNMDEAILRQILDVNEGLEYRIKKATINSSTVDELITNIKSKRYTQTRIQRILVHILLNMQNNTHLGLIPAKYARILGFTKNGQTFLQKAKKISSIPLITTFGKEQIIESIFDTNATKLYSLIEQAKLVNKPELSSLSTRDFKLPPIII